MPENTTVFHRLLDWSTGNIMVDIVLLVLSVSSILVVLDAVGFLPAVVSRRVNSNRLRFSIDLMKEMGVKIPDERRLNAQQSDANYKLAAEREIRAYMVNEPVTVGKTEYAGFPTFIDMMGASTDPATAKRLARILSTHAKLEATLINRYGNPEFDAVACPKGGSPILAYEFAQLMQRPLILHPEEPKFRGGIDRRAHFDFATIEFSRGGRALLVDDSTTGGRQMLKLAADLRSEGWEVAQCLVLFEPLGKGARRRLADTGITLHSVIDGPVARD